MWEGPIPLLASLQGGVAAALIKWREATETDVAGVVFLFVLNRKTTPASRRRRLRNIFLIARPPLLAVMQGGECTSPKLLDIFFTAPIDRAYSSLTRKEGRVHTSRRSTVRGCLRGIDKDIERSSDFIEELQLQGDVSLRARLPENLNRFF